MKKIGQKQINEILFKFYVGIDIKKINKLLETSDKNKIIYVFDTSENIKLHINNIPSSYNLSIWSLPNDSVIVHEKLMNHIINESNRIINMSIKWEPVAGINKGLITTKNSPTND
jgi:hypothetical protein